jgi:excisionase family DNA binding protein
MVDQRVYSTRELAHMWNVSESTIKRWTDSRHLSCYRTPGGHRKFRLEDIWAFQEKRGFETTGLLPDPEWEDPDIEVCVNQKNFSKVRDQIFYLAVNNQRGHIVNLLGRLYLRGISLVDLYDDCLMPVTDLAAKAFQTGRISLGQSRLAVNNLEEAMYSLFPRLIRKRRNGRTGLCGTFDSHRPVLVNALSRLLEEAGWECMNLGGNMPLDAMAELVEKEPVNLVCVVSANGKPLEEVEKGLDTLSAVAEDYRIPLALSGQTFADSKYRSQLPYHEYFPNCRSFRRFLVSLTH